MFLLLFLLLLFYSTQEIGEAQVRISYTASVLKKIIYLFSNCHISDVQKNASATGLYTWKGHRPERKAITKKWHLGLQKLDYKNFYSTCPDLWEHVLWEPNHPRKPKEKGPCGEEPRPWLTAQAEYRLAHRREPFWKHIFQSQLGQPRWSYVQQKQTVLPEPRPMTDLGVEINDYCFKPLSTEVVCYIAIHNHNIQRVPKTLIHILRKKLLKL